MKAILVAGSIVTLALSPAFAAKKEPAAKAAAPGQVQTAPGGAKNVAPGQLQTSPGGAKNLAPGQKN